MNTWYTTLTKPPLTPPGSVFPIAWGILYVLIAASVFLYAVTPASDKRSGYIFFIIQMILNLAWSPTFFVTKKIGLALIIACLLLLFIIFTIFKFYKVSKLSAILLVPYALWVSFAIYLNYGFLRLN